MRVEKDLVRPFADRLRYETAVPPRGAVLALFVLVPTPLEVLSVAAWEAPGHRGRASWILLGLEPGGLAIVRADAEAEAGDDDGVVSARWHPDAHLRCVGVTAIETFREQPDLGDYLGRLSWFVRIEGEGELALPTPEDGDATRIEEFCRRLQVVLGARRDDRPAQ